MLHEEAQERDLEMLDVQKTKQECERLEDVWKVLSDATGWLKSRGVNVPSDIYTSLRGAKVLINLCKTYPKLEDLTPDDVDAHAGYCVGCCGADIVTRVRCELRNIEDLLVITATNEAGSKFALELQEKTKRVWEPAKTAIVGAAG